MDKNHKPWLAWGCCVKIQVPGLNQNRSASLPFLNKPGSHFGCNSQESFNPPSVRGLHSNFQTSHKGTKDFDEESLASVSSEEQERGQWGDRNYNKMPVDMNKALSILFQSEEVQLLSIKKSFPLLHCKRKIHT